MDTEKIIKLIVAAIVICGLNACSLPGTLIPTSAPTGTVDDSSQTSLAATYTTLTLGGGKLFTLDPAQSTVRIYVFRAGAAARLGHNHVLSAPLFTGYFYLPGSGTGEARFDLEFRLDALEIDNPEYRASLGPAFASHISPDMIASTREHMLGEANLQAERFPLVRIHSRQIIGESPKFAARINVELHGQVREMWLPLQVTGLPDSLSASGSLVLRQTDFGIRPYSVLGGMLAVQDQIVIDFTLRARAG